MCLKELLNKSEYQLNWEFKFSLLGMLTFFITQNSLNRISSHVQGPALSADNK